MCLASKDYVGTVFFFFFPASLFFSILFFVVCIFVLLSFRFFFSPFVSYFYTPPSSVARARKRDELKNKYIFLCVCHVLHLLFPLRILRIRLGRTLHSPWTVPSSVLISLFLFVFGFPFVTCSFCSVGCCRWCYFGLLLPLFKLIPLLRTLGSTSSGNESVIKFSMSRASHSQHKRTATTNMHYSYVWSDFVRNNLGSVYLTFSGFLLLLLSRGCKCYIRDMFHFAYVTYETNSIGKKRIAL